MSKVEVTNKYMQLIVQLSFMMPFHLIPAKTIIFSQERSN